MPEDFKDIEASGLALFIRANRKTLMRIVGEMEEQGLLDFDDPGSGSHRW